jgi:hypothetical protein
MTHGLRQTAWYTPLFEQIDVPSGQIARVVSVNRWIAEDAAPFEVHHLFSQGENWKKFKNLQCSSNFPELAV